MDPKTRKVFFSEKVPGLIHLAAVDHQTLLVVTQVDNQAVFSHWAIPDGGIIRSVSMLAPENSWNTYGEDFCSNQRANMLLWRPTFSDGHGGGMIWAMSLNDLGFYYCVALSNTGPIVEADNNSATRLWSEVSNQSTAFTMSVNTDGSAVFLHGKGVSPGVVNEGLWIVDASDFSTFSERGVWRKKTDSSSNYIVNWLTQSTIMCHDWADLATLYRVNLRPPDAPFCESAAPAEVAQYNMSSRLVYSRDGTSGAVCVRPNTENTQYQLAVFETQASGALSVKPVLPANTAKDARGLQWNHQGDRVRLALQTSASKVTMYSIDVRTETCVVINDFKCEKGRRIVQEATPDGAVIIRDSTRAGQRNIYLLDADFFEQENA